MDIQRNTLVNSNNHYGSFMAFQGILRGLQVEVEGEKNLSAAPVAFIVVVCVCSARREKCQHLNIIIRWTLICFPCKKDIGSI